MFKNAKKLFAQAFIVLLAASFLTWGANSYFVNTPKSVAIEVNGEKVSVSELQTEYNFRLREAEKQFGGKLSDEFLSAMRLGNATVNRIITSKLALDESRALGFRASTQALRSQIINNPAFQDENGNFNKDVYRASVSNYGYSTSGYEKILKEEMVKENLFNLFTTHVVHEDYLTNLFKHQNAEITIRSLMINDSHIDKISDITAAEIKAYYDSNSHRFNTEETRDFTTLVLRADKLSNRVTVTEAEAKEVYNADPEAFSSDEERKASHILVSTEEAAVDIINQIDQGADFATLAKEKSTDSFTASEGGNLGYFIYEDMVGAFSDTAFNMEIGAVSEPVQSPFGFHIIKLEDIKEAKPQSFEDVKELIIADLKQEKSIDLYYDLYDKVEDSVASGKPLVEIANAHNLEADVFNQVKATQTTVKFAADVMPVVFGMEEGQVSDAISIEGQDSITVFAELNKLNKARTLTIDEARERIVLELTEAKKQKLIAEKAQNLLIERQNKQSLTQVAVTHNLSDDLYETAGIRRNGANSPSWLQTLQINLLFAMKEGDALSTLVNTPDGMALVELVSLTKNTPDAVELELFAQQVSTSWQEDLFAQYMLQKRNEANIDINQPSIEYALGSSYVRQ